MATAMAMAMAMGYWYMVRSILTQQYMVRSILTQKHMVRSTMTQNDWGEAISMLHFFKWFGTTMESSVLL